MYKELFDIAKLRNLEQFQIMKISNQAVEIKTYNDTLDKYEYSNIDKYIVSAIYQEKEVKLYTEYLDDTILDTLIEQSKYLENKVPPTRRSLENIEETKKYTIEDTTNITNKMLNLNNLKKQYKELKEITSYYTIQITERTIITETNKLYDINYQKNLFIEVLATNNNKKSTSYNSKSTTNNTDIDYYSLAKEVIQNAIDKLYYQEINNGTYNIILTSKVMGSILNKFCDLFGADSIQKDTSLLVDKQNKKVFSDKITIIEDPANPNLLGKRLFDDTGKITTYKEIVKDGIFLKPLYDERTATIDKTESTGNDYGTIRPRNMYIKPGTKTLEELINTLESGILIDSVTGLHAGINPINGDISIQSEGYYIEHGKKKYASKLFVLSTNIMDILNNVTEISNHIEFSSIETSSPDLLIKNIKISK